MVDFVGAGSGAADLITVRGMKLLEKADVVIYAGSLVSEELLNYCKKECEIHNSAYMTLEQVIEVILEAERNNKNTVRLHTGDPSIYGAIKEQMDILEKNHIEYRVCPGVSSFCAAAAALKVEYTLPGVSQSVIITRISGRTKVKEEESLKEFAKHKASMAIFLSTGHARRVLQELIEGGYEKNTPAAVVYKVSHADEMIIRCKLEEIADRIDAAGINNTALILVGGFLGDDYELSRLYDAGFSTGFRESSK